MSIIKRPTAVRKVVSRFDPSWRFTSHVENAYTNYCDTLDLKYVEQCGPLPDPLTVFQILPLKVTHECFVDGKNTNWWEIFRAHVTEISGVQLKHDRAGRLDDSVRDELGFDVVKDIADMIVNLANTDGVSCFFTLPGGYWVFLQNCERLLAKEKLEADMKKVVHSEDAVPSV